MMDTPPNILFMIPHDLGTFLSTYGNPSIKSPHLDAMASEGVSFSNCFTTTAECTPSRGAMMTGLMPHQNGLMGLSNFGWALKVPHLAQRLKDLGYKTHHFGFQHETHEQVETLGYDHAHHEGGNQVDAVCKNVCEFLNSAESEEGPWFIYAGFYNVHRDWPKADRFTPEDVEVPSWLPDEPVVRKDLARFYQDIEDMDSAAGTVLNTLKETELDKDTMAIFTTDHGAAFPGAKATMYDPGIHIPLIMHQPGTIEGGMVYDQLISSMDIAPTLVETAGGEAPEGMQGRSFYSLLNNGEYRERDEVSGALFYDVAYDPIHYVRTRKHKYIRSFAVTDEEAEGADQETLTTFEAGRWIRVDDLDVLTSPTWQALKPEEGSARPAAEELYDLTTDPDERKNLVSDPAYREVLADMRQRMQRMMTETDSPLLNGHVKPPDKQREAARTHGPNSEISLRTTNRRRDLI